MARYELNISRRRHITGIASNYEHWGKVVFKQDDREAVIRKCQSLIRRFEPDERFHFLLTQWDPAIGHQINLSTED